MSFWDSIGAIGGGIGGFFLGGPAGAMAGAGIGGSLGHSLGGMFGDSDGGAMDTLRARQAMYQKLLGELPTYQGPPPGQGLMPQDLAAMRQAQQQAGQVASGREQALLAQDRMSGGGAANSGKLLSAQMQAGQSAMDRLSNSDMAIAGQAAARDAQNRQLINQFNQQNMYNKLAITGGMAGSASGIADLQERNNYAKNANETNLFNTLGAAGLYGMQMGKQPKYGPGATGEVPTNKSADNIGIDTPWGPRAGAELNTTAGPEANDEFRRRYGASAPGMG